MGKKVGIIGCGNIAGGADSPQRDTIQTHAKAISLHPDFELNSCFDIDTGKAREFADLWRCGTCHTTVEELLSAGNDILVVAAPTAAHARLLRMSADSDAELIICEKPLVADAAELDIVRDLRKNLVVNFIRRWDTSHQLVRKGIAQNQYGALLAFNAFVAKGLLHNGAHLVDLLQHWFGEVENIEPLRASLIEGDLFGDYRITIAGGVAGLVSVLSNVPYSFFEIELVFSGSRISLRDIGNEIVIQNAKPSKETPGFVHLETVRTLESTLRKSLYNLYDDIANQKIDYALARTQTISASEMLFKLKDEVAHACD